MTYALGTQTASCQLEVVLASAGPGAGCGRELGAERDQYISCGEKRHSKIVLNCRNTCHFYWFCRTEAGRHLNLLKLSHARTNDQRQLGSRFHYVRCPLLDLRAELTPENMWLIYVLPFSAARRVRIH